MLLGGLERGVVVGVSSEGEFGLLVGYFFPFCRDGALLFGDCFSMLGGLLLPMLGFPFGPVRRRWMMDGRG